MGGELLSELNIITLKSSLRQILRRIIQLPTYSNLIHEMYQWYFLIEVVQAACMGSLAHLGKKCGSHESLGLCVRTEIEGEVNILNNRP